MHTSLSFIVCLSVLSPSEGAETPAPVRSAPLDSLAADISMLGFIPSGGEFLVLAASNGWFGLISEVRITPVDAAGDDPSLGLLDGEDTYYGTAPWSQEGDIVLVTAPEHSCYPSGVPCSVIPGTTFSFVIMGFGRLVKPSVALGSPGLNVVDINPDSSGTLSLTLDDPGVYWVEVMQHTDRGPSIELLFPIVSGGNVNDVFSGSVPVPRSDASSSGEVLEEINGLRESLSLPELQRDPVLDSLASIRAGNLALSGTLDHIDTETGSLEELLPERTGTYGENIGRGRGYQEAWSMIMTSPFHLQTCISPEYARVGMAGAVETDDYRWQLVLVQVFTYEGTGK